MSLSGTHVVILEAAVLLEANWLDLVHEVWSCVIAPTEVKCYILKLCITQGMH